MKRPLLVIAALAVYFGLVSLLAWVESGASDANIESVVQGMWFSVVTLTTVGYGDYYPVTPAGRVIGAAFILASLGLVGYFVGRITEHIQNFRERRRMGLQGTEFRDHVVIIGWDAFARLVTQQMLHTRTRVAVVTDQRDQLDLIHEEYSPEQVFVLFAALDNVEILDKVNLDTAHLVFVNAGSDTDRLIRVLNIRGRYPDARFLVVLESPELRVTFENAGVNHILSKTEVTAKLTASHIFEADVAAFENDLITTGRDAEDHDILQYRISEKCPLRDQVYGEVFQTLKRRFNAVPIGLARGADQHGRQLLKLPPDDTLLRVGDYLIVILATGSRPALAEYLGVEPGGLPAG